MSDVDPESIDVCEVVSGFEVRGCGTRWSRMCSMWPRLASIHSWEAMIVY